MVKLGIYSGLTVAFCCALITSNVLATKTLDLGMFALPASILTFPIMYTINDVLSDVYGFLAMRRTIVVGFNAITVAAIAYHLAIIVPGIQPEMVDAFCIDSWWFVAHSSRHICLICVGQFAEFVFDGWTEEAL